MADLAFEMIDVWKSFGGTKALSGVSLACRPGEVHALVGENGAGKSTLLKILSGAHRADSGRIRVGGRPVDIASPRDAQAHGIAIMYQEFNLVPQLTVAQNLTLAREPVGFLGIVDRRQVLHKGRELCDLLGIDIDLEAPVEALSPAQQQMVEIMKALAVDSRIVVMDEPTAALAPAEVQHLFDVIGTLKGRGASVIFVSHRIDEVMRISDSITVLKDGKNVDTVPTADTTGEAVVTMMVGRPAQALFPARRGRGSELALKVRGLGGAGTFRDIDLDVYKGEVVGLFGLEGNGQRSLVRALAGLETPRAGEVAVGDRRVSLAHPRQAMDRGIAFISDDRKAEGVVLSHSVLRNVSLPVLHVLARFGFVERRLERSRVEELTRKLQVRTPSVHAEVNALSGGNQQKVVIARALITEPTVIILDEPTRGIDVGAKAEIYELMRSLAADGAGVVMVSSDLLEVIGMCDRVLVMRNGRIVDEIAGETATEEAIMLAATGQNVKGASVAA